MHEFVYAKTLLKDIENVIDKTKEVKEIILELGELVGVEKEELKEALAKLSNLNYFINEKSSQIECNCGYKGKAKIEERLHDMVLFSCPNCNKAPQVLDGDKIKISKIIYK